jgi:septal ring factor EnvC (AmiA/AmiB activator)
MGKPEEHQSFRKSHPDFDFFFNKLAWAAITAVVSFAAIQLNKLSNNVAELNKNMALVVFQLQTVEKQSDQFKRDLDSITERVNYLEKRR